MVECPCLIIRWLWVRDPHEVILFHYVSNFISLTNCIAILIIKIPYFYPSVFTFSCYVTCYQNTEENTIETLRNRISEICFENSFEIEKSKFRKTGFGLRTEFQEKSKFRKTGFGLRTEFQEKSKFRKTGFGLRTEFQEKSKFRKQVLD